MALRGTRRIRKMYNKSVLNYVFCSVFLAHSQWFYTSQYLKLSVRDRGDSSLGSEYLRTKSSLMANSICSLMGPNPLPSSSDNQPQMQLNPPAISQYLSPTADVALLLPAPVSVAERYPHLGVEETVEQGDEEALKIGRYFVYLSNQKFRFIRKIIFARRHETPTWVLMRVARHMANMCLKTPSAGAMRKTR